MNRITRIRIKKLREIIRKGLKEPEIKKTNKIKQLEEIGIELSRLEIDINEKLNKINRTRTKKNEAKK